jgi:hypothetical protein
MPVSPPIIIIKHTAVLAGAVVKVIVDPDIV